MPATRAEGVGNDVASNPRELLSESKPTENLRKVRLFKKRKTHSEEKGRNRSKVVSRECNDRKTVGNADLSNSSFTIKSQQEFEAKVQASPNTVIIDFFALWCEPCKALAPRLESIIQRLGGKVQLAKINIDEMSELALEYDVSSVPVLVRMKDGKEQGRMLGLQSVPELEAFITSEERNVTNDQSNTSSHSE